MESVQRLCSTLLFVMALLLFTDLHFVVSAQPPQISPAPAPKSGGSNSPSPSPSPSSSPESTYYSPPAPPLYDLTPPPPTPAPAPSADAINHATVNGTANSEGSSSGGGLTGGQKAGIAIGVIASACIVGLSVVLYRKRQDNFRRSQYGYTARSEFL